MLFKREPFKIVLKVVDLDDNYSTQSFVIKSVIKINGIKSKIEINESIGCGLFNHDEKIFYFWKKNNEIMGLFVFLL